MTEAPRTVWVTKYALTKGVVEREVVGRNPFFIYVRMDEGSRQGPHLVRHEYRDTREAALARAEEMRAAKIASLRRQIERLESLEF